MTRITTSLVAALLATAVVAAPALAQTTTPAPTTTPSTTEKVKTFTKKEWAKLRAGWTNQKEKYTACNTKAKADGLKGTKRWGAVYNCMTM
jgi:hypothetical protein